MQVFEEAVRRRRFSEDDIQFMSEAYLRALTALDLIYREDRFRLARIIFKLQRTQQLSTAELAAAAIKEYLDSLAGVSARDSSTP